MHPNTKRRKILPRRSGERLTAEQDEQLFVGTLLRGGPFPFASEEHAKAAWFRHRAELMDPERRRHWRRYGWRPWGFWCCEIGIVPDRWGKLGCISQLHAVHKLTDDPAERAWIEAEWLTMLSQGILNDVPRDFARQHWRVYEQARARQEAERLEFQATMATLTGNAMRRTRLPPAKGPSGRDPTEGT